MILERIRALCKERGITVTGLERELGFSNNSISKWASSSPTVSRLKTVADFFGVTVDSLISE